MNVEMSIEELQRELSALGRQLAIAHQALRELCDITTKGLEDLQKFHDNRLPKDGAKKGG